MDDEFLKEIWEQFSIEVDEHCSNNEEILIGATSNELSEEQVNSAFRAFHTIKGLSRSLSLATLEKIAHSAEDVLGDVREGKFKLDDDAISVLLKANDQMRVISENSAKKMLEVADDPKELIINLNEIREREFDGEIAEKKDNEAIELSDEKNDLNVEDTELIGKMFHAAKKMAIKLGIDKSGYRTIFNCNDDGGQTVYHIHLHLIGGRSLGWPQG